MEEIVKGYEYEKGKFVILKDEDFNQIPSNEHKSVSILDFVNLQEIDPVYYDKAYYLAPGEGGQKVYHLLKTAMEQTGKVAVAKVMIRTKPSLAVLRVAQDTMMMNTMFYPDEVRQAENITELNYQIDLHDNELKMAINLINNLSNEFKAERYTNEYRQGLMDIIQAKITGEKVDDVVTTPDSEKVVDLMAALKASIDLAKEERKAPKKSVKRKKTS
jgi:DNA end-binding protein Ku